jgi:hypothetical protein
MTRFSQADAYQLRATQCARLAQTATDSQAKLMLLEIARAWLALAEQATKNSETVLVYETPTPYPAAQQQPQPNDPEKGIGTTRASGDG